MSMFRLVMLGDGGVGKSCLTVQLCHGFFTLEYDPTIENLYRKQITVDEVVSLLEILDTAGQEDYAAMRDQHILQGQGFGLVYSITNRQSFQQLGPLYQSILRVKEDSTQFPVVVFANKVDLELKRVVSTQEGKEFARRIGAPFFETSAKTRVNVEEAFLQLVRDMREWHKLHGESATTPGKRQNRRCALM